MIYLLNCTFHLVSSSIFYHKYGSDWKASAATYTMANGKRTYVNKSILNAQLKRCSVVCILVK